MSALWRTIVVQMFMRDLKKVSALWSVCFNVSTLERFCYKGFLRNSFGTKFFVCLREVSHLEDVRFREVPLYLKTPPLKKILQFRDRICFFIKITKKQPLFGKWLMEKYQIYNPGKNICLKVKKSSESEQDFKNLSSNFACFLTAIVKVSFLEGRLGTRLRVHPNLTFF